MDNWSLVGKWIMVAASGVASYLFGGWSGILGTLLFLVAIDYLTGIWAAFILGQLKSKIGLIGIARKVFIFAMVAIGHLVDGVLGDSHLFRDTIAFFYIANELLSIVENGGKLGAPIPPVIRQAVEVLKGKGGDVERGADKQ
ncbi:phage holin family protein [Paenibacillus sp. P96]|uniref:Phage holin family protein n=1 Tax=Paenibacillus zeirhizosphaerae TaxID=2987519 RepID=A0ABT9FL79_9BACL|nr:phage holin family protein [Paenibacillus sp. P96]MDP4095485.1 phage holin family protein [Paenibacillus sp. P96]